MAALADNDAAFLRDRGVLLQFFIKNYSRHFTRRQLEQRCKLDSASPW
jgi:hypothetical protein